MKFNKNILRIKKNDALYMYNLINDGVIKLPNHYSESEYLNSLTNKDIELLREQLYLDTDTSGRDITEVIEDVRNEMKYSDKYASFMIHLGYGCNMACSYCYQNNITNVKTMDKNTYHNILDFFEKVKKFNSLEVIDITFIGGEPLLYTSLIENFINQCNHIFDGINIKYSLVTNGLLLNERTIKILKMTPWDVIQITLDGTSKYHDSLRVDKQGKGTFSRILENLKDFQSMNLPIYINCNLNSQNYNGVDELLEILKIEGIHFPVCFSLIFDDIKAKTKKYEDNSKENENVWLKAHEIATKYQYTFKPFYRMPYMVCGLQRVNVFNISPDGKIYKCISGMEESKYLLSSVDEYMTPQYKERIAHFMEMPILKPKCRNCSMEVVCGGGCAFKNDLYGEQCIPTVLLTNESGILEDYVGAYSRGRTNDDE